MKSKFSLPFFLVLIFFFTGCQKPVNETNLNQNMMYSENSVHRKMVDADFNKEAYWDLIAANEARHSALETTRQGCVKLAVVPDDYSTIQEAMDAVCQNGTIIVKAGEYNENVLVDKPGLLIKATGDVTVNGCIYLFPVADKVGIYNFKINPDGPSENAYNGIYGYDIHQGQIINNTIVGIGDKGYGILLENSSNILIKNNQVSDFTWGIVFISYDGVRSSNNNIIQNNSVTGITAASCVGLEGDCNKNLISNNQIHDNASPANAGICLKGDGSMLPDNNTLEFNTLTNNYYTGIWIVNGTNNTVGEGNICSNTYGVDGIGFYFSAGVSKTIVYDNSVTDNTVCDIVYENGSEITFVNNNYGCFEEY